MNSGDLHDLFRSDVVDADAPYLWSETEVFSYMNAAYSMFVRLTGGIADVTSPLTQVPVVTGQMYAPVSPLILRFKQAWLVSTGSKVDIINENDTDKLLRMDYGQLVPLLMDNTPGKVRYMMIGLERNKTAGKVRWVQVPQANDTVQLSLFRLPLDTIAVGDMNFMFPEIGDEHVLQLMTYMKALAYGKQDAETFNRGKRDEYKAEFTAYCKAATAEWERYKHKTRVVTYGGL